jgi:hypothetical protein
MKKVQTFLMALLISLLTGCASTRQFIAFPDQNKGTESPEKGRIYIIRPPQSFGGGGVVDIYDGEKYVGVTTRKGFLSWERAPGVAKIQTEDPGGFSMALNVHPGNRYYLVQDFRWFKTATFHEVDSVRGKELLAETYPPKSAPPPKEYSPGNPKTPYLMRNDWGSLNGFSALYDFRRGVLGRYEVEKIYHRGPHSFRSVQFSVGVYGTTGAKVKVNFQDGTSRSGDLNVQSFPVYVGISGGRTHGSFLGKFGIGTSVYPFSGDINLHDRSGFYKASGTGVSIVLPFEGLVSFTNKSLVVRLDDEIRIPILLPPIFKNRFGGYIKGVPPMGWLYLGFSIGKLF